jgi:hypothetical protein
LLLLLLWRGRVPAHGAQGLQIQLIFVVPSESFLITVEVRLVLLGEEMVLNKVREAQGRDINEVYRIPPWT